MTLAEELIFRSNYQGASDRWTAYVDAMGLTTYDIMNRVDPTEVRLWVEVLAAHLET